MSSNWEHKLYNYQQEPPSSAWDAIEAGLDNEKTSFPEKLYHYEAAPPAAAWQKIEAQLPQATGGKVVAMSTSRKMIRYAAAAVILLALVSIAYFATPDNNTAVATTNSSQANPVLKEPADEKEIKHFNVPPQPATAATNVTTDNAAAYTLLENAVKRIRLKRAKVNLPAAPLYASAIAVAPTGKNMVDAERNDRYMIATTDDGNPVRLPKKVYSAFACPDDDPSHQACELQLTLLQQKMSTSLTTDFAHFLDLLKNLQENSR